MGLEDTVVAANYATLVARLCEEKGITSNQLLEGVDIDPNVFITPQSSISGQQFLSLIEKAYALYQDPAMGIHYGRKISISTHGMVGFAFMTSSSLRDGFNMILRFYKAIFSPLELKLEEKGERTHFQFRAPDVTGRLHEVMIEGFLIGFSSVISYILSADIPEIRVRLQALKQPHHDEFEEYYGVNVEYGCDQNELIFDSRALNTQFPAADPQTTMMARAHCEEMLKTLERYQGFAGQVKFILLSKRKKLPNLEALAEEMNMHPRTLGRKLNKCGTCYQTLLDNVRQELAMEYLANPEMLVEDIAYSLNFNDTSSFYRAFKRWTGKTPSEQRKIIAKKRSLSMAS